MADIDEASFSEDEERLWAELDKCLSTRCDSHESIDDVLRTWLDLTTKLRNQLLESHEEVLICSQMLLDSHVFQQNKEYVRTQIIHSLLQEDDAGPLHAIATLLLLDGQREGSTFPRMVSEACFPRLLELINTRQFDEDPRLHRFLLQLMYEMSRMERLGVDDLALADDAFIHRLFHIIEGVSDDVHDPYHYPTIRVLLVLNEQYMLASTDSATNPELAMETLTNRIVKCLSLHGPQFRTFGENLILLLNRETETSLQLLILKLLYLLFTTTATYEYFYTNDLRVLLDVIIRNLMDLPDERISLRHTYLRVLYPLLAHTQLNQPPHYKREEVIRLLKILRGSHNVHFAPADETTLRLVERVARVSWLEGEKEDGAFSGQVEVARKLLGISLSQTQSSSSVSVGDVAAVTERPGIQTPSRHVENKATGKNDTIESKPILPISRSKKPLPDIPTHRHGVPFVSVAKLHTNGGEAARKIPPKAPPPRRWGKTKAVEKTSSDPIEEGTSE